MNATLWIPHLWTEITLSKQQTAAGLPENGSFVKASTKLTLTGIVECERSQPSYTLYNQRKK